MKVDSSVIIEVSSKDQFIAQYPQLVEVLQKAQIDYSYNKDIVSGGSGKDFIIAGLVFVYQSAMSGITWDIICQTLKALIETILPEQKQSVFIYFQNKETKERIKISISDKNIDTIELKDKLKIKFTNE
jgi:hypothetical protein